MQNYERNPNLASKFKSNNNLPPFCQKKLSKVGKTTDLEFQQSFDQKEGQMLFGLNFEARFGILLSFCIFLDPFWYDFHMLYLSRYVLNTNVGGRVIFLENVNFGQLIVISVKKCIR